ncbi:MAG: phage tail protein I [Ardenticatenaceae bacterium]|nr:phage tail protein I [Anaerolineales bacterium]MCB8920854.1 phage tail protein I [Ardenticatenaceae bacterium]MCB8991632.1 phage tail protein I [Ardenticatenaceae bacterium]MCB9002728.1 phage tail protein I [Ardenticatenaceae bacterium]
MAQFAHEFKITGPQMSLTFTAPEGTTTIGRSTENDLVFVHPLVSRRHARLESSPEACQVVDLGSTHGTMVNRKSIEAQSPVTLQTGDVIEIGAFRMVYQQLELVQQTPVYEPPVEIEPEPVSVPEPAPVQEPEAYLAEEEPVTIEGELVEETAVTQPSPPEEETTRTYAPIPPLPPQPPSLTAQLPESNGQFQPPPGLSATYSRYLEYLPEIYHAGPGSFITRFLALLESILTPIEWNIDNFDLYLDPKTSPNTFLPWLANWYEMTFDESWSESSQRQLLLEASEIYPRRGTVWALRRILEIYTGVTPDINDQGRSLEAFMFTVRFPLREQQVNRTAIERIINANKPAHTNYTLIFQA